MRKKYFFRFFSVTFISIILMFIVGIVAVRVNADTMMKARIKEETEMVCSLVEKESDFTKFAKYESDDAFRITVVDLNGNVLYESDTKSPLENHVTREEIVNAINGSPVAVKRYSETMGVDMTYYAKKTELMDGTEIVIRLAIKSAVINGYLGVALPILVVVLVVALVACLFVSDFFAKNVSKKISEIGKSLKSLNDGDYAPITTDSGEPEFFSVLTEINELNESTHNHILSISEEHNKLNTVLENVSQGIIAVDGKGKIAFANKSALDVFCASGSVVGKEIIYLVDDVDLCDTISDSLGKNFETEYKYKGIDLSVVIRGVDKTVRQDLSSIIIITDVTKERALQKQKNDFFANASHELKTPVTVMQGLSEILLAKNDLESGDKKKIERIHKESLRLSSLISDMLKLSRLENGTRAEETLSKVELSGVAAEVVSELSEEINKKGLSVKIDGFASVTADNAKIFEIMQNLCSNAVNYNVDHGKIEIKIFEDENQTTLIVSDTGIGIEKENISRLCERFYRVDKSRSKKTGGTGLGLAIVKHICALYNAKLFIDSEIGIGTTVKVVFPK